MKTMLEGDFNRFTQQQALSLICSYHPDRKHGVRQILALWLGRYKERREMRRDLRTIGFNDAVLEDFGMTRHEAEREASKYFWQA
nr:hypothetical protein [uncultured Cohaesibacter sp.]